MSRSGAGLPGSTIRRLLSPAGRLNRTTYAVLCLAVVAVGAVPVAFAISSSDITTPGWFDLALVALLPPLWLWIVASIRRLHDIGLPGRVMFFALTPLAGPQFVSLVCALAPGERVANAYGPPPKSGLGI